MNGAIVVGVDGSEASREALRWAADEAGLRSARLVAVHASSLAPPQPIGDPGMLVVSPSVPASDLSGQLGAESYGSNALDRAVRDTFGADSEINVERKLVEGDAGEALVKEGTGAELLVVGSHGWSGFKAALLGSVSRYVVAHATCPVVVVKTSK